MANCRIKTEKAYCEESREEEREEKRNILTLLWGKHTLWNSVTITKALKVAHVSKMTSLITLRVMGIWDTQKVFPMLTTAPLFHWCMTLQTQLLSVHSGFDSQEKPQHHSLRFLHVWIINEKHFSLGAWVPYLECYFPALCCTCMHAYCCSWQCQDKYCGCAATSIAGSSHFLINVRKD